MAKDNSKLIPWVRGDVNWTNVGTWATFDYFFRTYSGGGSFPTEMIREAVKEVYGIHSASLEGRCLSSRRNLAISENAVLVDNSTFSHARKKLLQKMRKESREGRY